MKICLISKQFYPKTIGGAEVYMYEIYKRIKKDNNITILTYDDVDYEEAEVIFVPKIHFTISSFLFSIIAGLKARFGDYDIVHINGYWAEFSGLFVRNDIVTIHDVGFLGKKGVLNKIRFFILGAIMKSAKRVITVSEKTKEEILRHFKINEDKIEVIPNGIDLEKYNLGSGEEIRKRYGINEKKIIFSFGRFARNKGYEYLIDAFKEVNQKLKNSYLIIAGRAEDRKYLEELEKRAKSIGINNILLLQNVSEDEKLSLFAACDIYCQPSIAEEGFGIALLEAMASGKAFVATKIFSGIEHIPEEFLVEERSAKELGDRIIQLLNLDYKEIGMEMRRKVEKYSCDNTVDEILKLYREVKMT